MKKAKKTIKEIEIIDSVTVKKPEFKIVQNGHCFELIKTDKGVSQKVFIKATTDKKSFEIESKKYIN